MNCYLAEEKLVLTDPIIKVCPADLNKHCDHCFDTNAIANWDEQLEIEYRNVTNEDIYGF